MSPKELFFPAPHHLRAIRNELTIRNSHKTGYLLFKVKCAWPLQYVAKPSTGVVLPGAAQTVSIKLKPIDMPAALLNDYPRPIADAFVDVLPPDTKLTPEDATRLGLLIPVPLIKTCTKQLNHFFSKEMIKISIKLIEPFSPETVKQVSTTKDFAAADWESHRDVPLVLEQRLGLRWSTHQSAIPEGTVMYYSPSSAMSTAVASAATHKSLKSANELTLRKGVSFAAGGDGNVGEFVSAEADGPHLPPPTRGRQGENTTDADGPSRLPQTSNDNAPQHRHISDLKKLDSDTALLDAHSGFHRTSSSRDITTKGKSPVAAISQPPPQSPNGQYAIPPPPPGSNAVDDIKHSMEQMNTLYMERSRIAEEIQQLTMKKLHIELEMTEAKNRTLVVKESHAAVAREMGESIEEATARAEQLLQGKRNEHRRKMEEAAANAKKKGDVLSQMVYLKTVLIAMIVCFVAGAFARHILP